MNLKPIFISDINCVTPLGFDLLINVEELYAGKSAIQKHESGRLMPEQFFAAIIDEYSLDAAFSNISGNNSYSKLEKMMILALHPLVNRLTIGDRTGFILSTTKGNINALSDSIDGASKAELHQLAVTVASFFGITTEPIVISNACVSGIMALSVAKRLIQAEMYDEIYVIAGDEVTEFVLSGFSSFQAMSAEPCKPYSINRSGVTIGEAAAAARVTAESHSALVEICGDGSINDANHISGPSRTGEGLYLSIISALKESGLNASNIDFISAHGTATSFNDEMEAVAFNRLNLQNVPVNSLKGYFGHTLGASGLLETVLSIAAVQNKKLFASHGFDESGVSMPLSILKQNAEAEVRNFLKTASGFGGCNTAVVFSKVD
ncbi:MAG TPA: beta-ketoacyl synthase N-terminal-like domain-containing protein [Flavobacterium sp.]